LAPSDEFHRRTVHLGPHEVCVTSYPIGRKFSSRVDNVSPGANIGRGMGETRAEAETAALAGAAARLGLPDIERALRADLDAIRGR